MKKLSLFCILTFLILTSCSKNNREEIENLNNSVKSPILCINKLDHPIFENDIFTLNGKKSFKDCEIRKNPEVFNDKLLRIETYYGFMIHGSYLFDKNRCEGVSNAVQKSIHVEFRSEKDFNYIDELNVPSIELKAIGKFSMVKPTNLSDSIHDQTPYHFEIICLEEIKK